MDEQTDLLRVADGLTANARDLEADLGWLGRVLEARLNAYFAPEAPGPAPLSISPPDLGASHSPYAEFLQEFEVAPQLRLIILLALAPHVRPQLLDVLWTRNEATQRTFSEFGGAPSAQQTGFLPTGETAAFLLAGDQLAARFEAMRLFDGDRFLARRDVVRLGPVPSGEPPLNGLLIVSRDCLHRFTTGAERSPSLSAEFPARLVETRQCWDDLVLPSASLEQLDEIRQWIQHGPALLQDWEMGQKLGPGYASLFYGPPGTGKTLSACLLGKYCGGRDVYKVDLSLVVSKWVGETSQNLGRVFDMAEHRKWLLFFDEADALFGRRARLDDSGSQTRWANQEISFLLQRIESFDGVVILASNLKNNIDDAFLRRFQSMVYFPMPRAPERLRMWQNAFPRKARLDVDVDLGRLAEKHEMSGGTIMNVARYASLMTLSRGAETIQLDDLEEGIRRERLKEGFPC
jgi:hypothetical protein